MTARQETDMMPCPMCNGISLRTKAEVKKYIYLECQDCSLVFCPKISAGFLKTLYLNGFHGLEEGAPKKGWKKDAAFLDPVFEFLPKEKPLKILDFGTGQDRIPDLLRQEGHRVMAVDLVPPLRPHPDRITGDIMEMDLEPGQFDLIYSFQVFEHLPNPRQILGKLLKLVRPEGIVLLHTDMETEERYKYGFKKWWYVMPPDHCTLYSHKTFEQFAKCTGNQIVWKDEKRVILKRSRSIIEGSPTGSRMTA